MIVTVANQKGGVGKTDVTVNLASYLANNGKKVLIIDLDPQANATTYLMKRRPRVTTCDLLLDDKIKLSDAVSRTQVRNLDIIAGNPTLNIAQIHLMSDAGMQFKLKRKIDDTDYDFIFIDTPPSLGMLTINALTASNEVLIPLNAHYLSTEGVSKLINAVKSLKKEINPQLSIRGFVITMSTKKNPVSDSLEKHIRGKFKKKVFENKIPYSPHLIDAPRHHKPISLHAEKSVGAVAYRRLAEEFLNI